MAYQYRGRGAGRPEAMTAVAVLLDNQRRRGDVAAVARRVVLYVNADAESRILLNRLSRRWSQVEMVMADSAQEGLQLATARRPDLVMMDVELPDVDGTTLMARLRGLPATALTPIVALSTDGSPEHRRSLLEAGASACLTRPVNIAEVQRYLGALLGVGRLAPV